MAVNNRPRQRDKHITGTGLGIRKGPRGGNDSVGRGQSGLGKPGANRSKGRKGMGNRIPVLALIMSILVGGGGMLSTLRTSGGLAAASGPIQVAAQGQDAAHGQTAGQEPTSGQGVSGTGRTGRGKAGQDAGALSSLAGLLFPDRGWSDTPNTGKLNTAVSPAARDKYTVLRGGGADTATVMIYLCGTDLESKKGMAASDLGEMLDALSSAQVNLVLCSGGCGDWKNESLTNGLNQLWQIRDGGLVPVEDGPAAVTSPDAAMTDPDTLSAFLAWCAASYPADRNILILWDHGGGSLSGFGYDENHAAAGSLSLSDIDTAMADAGVKFDLVGFDACLMATVETALMLSRHADYLIASEETEPAGGWSYTGWLTDLAKNPSRPTLELGRRIVDDFVDSASRSYRGQAATLSVTDLAELGQTLGDRLNAFARDARNLMEQNGVQQLSAARTEARDFPASVDQVDLAHFARNLETESGDALAATLLNAVKYNRTASAANAYGLSAYFPWDAADRAEDAVLALEGLGLGGEYTRCLREFAALEAAGRYASGGTESPASVLSNGADAPASRTAEQTAAFLGRVLGGQSADSGEDGIISEARLETLAERVTASRFDPAWLVWTDGKLSMTEEQWGLVRDLEVNVFYDDGEGYLDLGLDNSCKFDENGNLLDVSDGAWFSINGQPVSCYILSSVEDGDHYVDTRRVPVLLNGESADLILLYTDEQPYGYIAGARPLYANGETETVFRGLTELEPGDELVFQCDYYSYDEQFDGWYPLGPPMTVTENMAVSDMYLGGPDGGIRTMYRFTDLYGNHWWTEPGA